MEHFTVGRKLDTLLMSAIVVMGLRFTNRSFVRIYLVMKTYDFARSFGGERTMSGLFDEPRISGYTFVCCFEALVRCPDTQTTNMSSNAKPGPWCSNADGGRSI